MKHAVHNSGAASPLQPVLLIEATRGDFVESRHYGAASVWGPEGQLVGWGDVETPVFPRSAIKPIQALPLVESGAAGRWRLGAAELALACASHGGEPRHVRLVRAWLEGMGSGPDALGCGTHWPSFEPAARDLAAAGEVPCALHNNCSGKHAGFVATALHLGEDPDGYLDLAHPVQQRWIQALAELCDVDLGAPAAGIDGCGIPTLAVPLLALARAFQRMARPEGMGQARQAAIRQILAAMAEEPFLVAGTDRFCTNAMRATGGRLLVKVGAEGVYCGSVPEAGLGFALKIADGATRAAQVAVPALLRQALGGDHPIVVALEPMARLAIETRRGVIAGQVRPAGVLLG